MLQRISHDFHAYKYKENDWGSLVVWEYIRKLGRKMRENIGCMWGIVVMLFKLVHYGVEGFSGF